MKVLLDTNVIIDILGQTEDVLYSLQALDVMLLRNFEPCIVVSAAPTIHYVLASRKMASRARGLAILGSLSALLTILDATESDFRRALDAPLGDFEDAMLAWAAERQGVDLIVTRNVRDFEGSPIAVMSPQQFCDVYTPADYHYDLVEFPEGE